MSQRGEVSSEVARAGFDRVRRIHRERAGWSIKCPGNRNTASCLGRGHPPAIVQSHFDIRHAEIVARFSRDGNCGTRQRLARRWGRDGNGRQGGVGVDDVLKCCSRIVRIAGGGKANHDASGSGDREVRSVQRSRPGDHLYYNRPRSTRRRAVEVEHGAHSCERRQRGKRESLAVAQNFKTSGYADCGTGRVARMRNADTRSSHCERRDDTPGETNDRGCEVFHRHRESCASLGEQGYYERGVVQKVCIDFREGDALRGSEVAEFCHVCAAHGGHAGVYGGCRHQPATAVRCDLRAKLAGRDCGRSPVGRRALNRTRSLHDACGKACDDRAARGRLLRPCDEPVGAIRRHGGEILVRIGKCRDFKSARCIRERSVAIHTRAADVLDV